MSKAVGQYQRYGGEVSVLWWAGSDSWGQDRSRPRRSGITQLLHYCSEIMLLFCSPECESLKHSALQIFLVYSPFLSQFTPPFLNFIFPLQRESWVLSKSSEKGLLFCPKPSLARAVLGNRSTVTHIAVQDKTIN